jgi:hypothetical protein
VTGAQKETIDSNIAASLTRGNRYAAEVLNVYNPLIQNAGKPRPQTRRYSLAATTSYNLAGIAGDNRILKNLRIGGGASWASKAAIGTKYATPEFDLTTNAYLVRRIDPSALYYDDPVFTANAFASYAFKLNKGRIRSSVQLNVQNMLEDGRLQPVAVRTDGTPWAFRIVDPRLFQLTFNFEL